MTAVRDHSQPHCGAGSTAQRLRISSSVGENTPASVARGQRLLRGSDRFHGDQEHGEKGTPGRGIGKGKSMENIIACRERGVSSCWEGWAGARSLWKNLERQAQGCTRSLKASVLRGDSKEQMRRNPLEAGPLVPTLPFLSPHPIWTLSPSFAGCSGVSPALLSLPPMPFPSGGLCCVPLAPLRSPRPCPRCVPGLLAPGRLQPSSCWPRRNPLTRRPAHSVLLEL